MSNRNGSYPMSVQPGIPNLTATPKKWKSEPLGKYLKEVKRPAEMDDDEQYQLVTVKRSRGGVEERDKLFGREIKVKSQFYVKAGDFLISKRQIVHGACGIVPENLDGAIVSSEYAVLGTNGGIDLDYLRYLSESIHFQQTCFHSSIGVHVEKMIFKLDRWLKWDFNIPPLPEQQKIVRILSTWDNAIKTIEKLIENSQQQKKALMQKLLTGKRRLAVFNHQWAKIPLKEICATFSGGTPSRKRKDYYNGNIPWIKSGEVNLRKILSTEENITEQGLVNSSAKMVEPNTILIAMYGATAGKVAISKIQASINQAILAITPKTKVDNDYLFYTLEQKMEHVKSLVQGAQPNLNAEIIKNILIKLPCYEEQVRIGSILRASEEIVEKHCQSKQKILQEKRALMQQLLTGKRRVKLDQ